MTDEDMRKLQRDVARLKHVLRVMIGWVADATDQPMTADMRLLLVLLDQIDQEDG